MKNLLYAAALFLALTTVTFGGDLYRVTIASPAAARSLAALEINPLLRTDNVYLLLCPEDRSSDLAASGLDAELLSSDLTREQLALDTRRDDANADRFEVLYVHGGVRLLRIEDGLASLKGRPVDVYPLLDGPVEISYRAPSRPRTPSASAASRFDLPDLISAVSQSSLTTYTNMLQAAFCRLAGTPANRQARDWVRNRFLSFGYDSVVIDQFEGAQLWDRDPCTCFNVLATKVGSVYPERHIIVGGHFDAVPDSPGADDNGSGTAAVLEIARVLADVETKTTIVFIAFDSEESGLHGSYHYTNRAVNSNEDIVVMINLDMIAHWENSDRADLYTGGETAFAEVWDQLANDNVGIDADLRVGAASDHWPFQQAGYDVVFVQEKIFSTVYHTPQDSTDYMDFDYMTRMVQATAAAIYTIDQYPPSVQILSVEEPGDGSSQIINWRRFNSSAISHYQLSYHPLSSPDLEVNLDLPPTDSSYTVTNLTEGEEYELLMRVYDTSGQASLVDETVYFVPQSRPAAPFDISALPLREAVRVTWSYDNRELDFDHCAVLRDGEIIGETLESSFIDADPSLGFDLHDYRVITVDTGGLSSDTLGIEPSSSRAATLQTDRVLAINRTQIYPADLVDEVRTGAFLREALAGYNFDYFSDTAAIPCQTGCDNLTLNDMLDYGVVVVGAETAIWEDLGQNPLVHGILDTLAYYLSIGGKAVVFGRWGGTGGFSQLDYRETASPFDDAYFDYFHIESRTRTPTRWNYADPVVPGDFIGASTQVSTYPDLPWDSAATLAHATAQDIPISDVGGIPCATWAVLDSTELNVLYGYDSRDDDNRSEGKPVAWRYFGLDYAYVFFDVPLSLVQRDSAIEALQQAVDELIAGAPEPWTPVEPPEELPKTFVLWQNYPNPFNDGTVISFYLPEACRVKLEIFNILGQRVSFSSAELRSDFYSIEWQAGGLASGVYFYRLTAGDFVETRKMMLLK